MRSKGVLALISAVATTVLTGCGGGGSSSGPSTYGGAPPTAAASATPTPSATPTAAPLSYTGRVVDAGHGKVPVVGATVTLGTTIAYTGTAYMIAGFTTMARTAADGSFTVAGIPGQLFIEVDASGLVSLHRPLPTNSTRFGTLALPTATAEDTAGLAELNMHRQKLGSGNGTRPLSLDADLELLARYRVADMAANGYFGHTAPGQSRGASEVYLCTIDTGAFCASPSASPIYDQENIAADAPSQAASEDGYVVLGPTDGHYQNIVSRTDLWVGFGEAQNGKPAPGLSGTVASYYAEEFFTSTANPEP
ncbi:MAG TPA: CAP domain-containing protein [Candidatus Baltobacteraceae bacterium]|nr:CAP domain-containing protein [Candidatus Baltobacteraceae bacterium]